MGEIVLAARCTHVPTMFMLMSDEDGPVKGKRPSAVDGQAEIAGRARALVADSGVIGDTAWVSSAECQINADDRSKGLVASNEFPKLIQDMPRDHEGSPALGDAIAPTTTRGFVYARSRCGDGPRHGMAMLHDVPARYAARGRCQVVTPNFPSSATGQTNVILPVN